MSQLKKLKPIVNKSKDNWLSGPQLRQALLAALSRREHSRRELLDKFSKRVESTDELEFLLTTFADNGWQCDYRYARSLVRSKYNSNYGPRVILQLLQQQEIPNHLFQQIIIDESIDWHQSCLDLACKKLVSLIKKNLNKLSLFDTTIKQNIEFTEYISLFEFNDRMNIKNKLVQYLLRRGFSNHDCQQAIAEFDFV